MCSSIFQVLLKSVQWFCRCEWSKIALLHYFGHWLIQQLVRDSPIANAAYKIIAIKNSNNNNKIIILNSGKSIFANVCPSVKNVYCVFFLCLQT